MLAKLDDFKRYSPKKTEIIEGKKAILTDKEKLYDQRNMVIETFENGVFPFKMDFKKNARCI